MKILVIDDSKAMRIIVRKALRLAGFEPGNISEAANGTEALQLVRTTNPDLLLCDWNMPGMNGLELLQELRASGCRTKFGFITSESTEVMRVRAAEAGASFLIVKPFTPEHFEEVICKECPA
jgi:two-component system chemotaxis response regulator CheY